MSFQGSTIKASTVVTPEYYGIHASRAMRTTYPGYVLFPPSGTIACRALGGKKQQPKPPAKKKSSRRQPKRAQPKAAQKKAPAPLRMFSIGAVQGGVPTDHIAIFCHSSCGVRLRPDTTDPELEFLGTANLLHKKWEVLLKAKLRCKFSNAMAHVAGSKTSTAKPKKAKAAPTLQQKPKGKQQPRKKCSEGLTFADFDAAGAAPDFELTPVDFELLREQFLAGEFAVQHAALAERFLREMRFSLVDPALDAAVVAEPAKKTAKVEAQRPRPQRQQWQQQQQQKVVEALYPLSANELAQLMEQTKGRMLQENSFLGRLSRFVRKGTADGSIVWNEERSCFITTRSAMETQCFGGDKGDVWRSLNMFGPFLTRQQCREL